MTDFLLELRSEEIPARMQGRAREDLARLFTAELARAGLAAAEIATYATPRRLALIARGLPEATEAVREEVKGPKASAPAQALEGFLRKTGLTRDQLEERDGVLFAVTERAGRAASEVLAEAIPAVIRAFPWPKSMRWGEASLSTESLRWVRPLQGIVALFGDKVVPVSIAGVESGTATVGHRFHHPGAITIGSADDYVEKLRACHVIVDQDARAALIRDRAAALAAGAGLVLVGDEGLVAENAGLTEWPVPLLGRFDEAFLDVPPEVIQLTARVNQKYFVCRDAEGRLANAFVCTANIAASDGGAKIVEGNRKVLAARLSDARFFYETDLKVPLEVQAEKLSKIVFHEKLGTVADKVERVAKLARWLVAEGIIKSSPLRGEGDHAQHGGGGVELGAEPGSEPPPPPAAPTVPLPVNGEDTEHLVTLADRAARLCKADLVTGMVGEFPELQGLIGGHYAAAQNEDPQVAAAIRDHYKPVGQGDEVPTAPVTVAVSLADKLDTIFSFFSINERPSGSRDPFALRRAALGVLAICQKSAIRLPLAQAATAAAQKTIGPALIRRAQTAMINDVKGLLTIAPSALPTDPAELAEIYSNDPALKSRINEAVEHLFEFIPFLIDRLKVQQREAGVRHDLIDAVFALGGEDDLVRLLARVRALQAFVGTEDGANLLAGYKRAANILTKEGYVPSPRRGASGEDSPGLSSDRAGRDRPDAGEPRSGEGEGQDDAPRSGTAHLPSAASGGSLPLPGGERGIPLSYTPERAESDLIAALDAAEPAAAAAVAREDFEGAMAALATLRAPIDTFFDTVTVNDPDADKRAARLALLARVRAAVHAVADFSRIKG